MKRSERAPRSFEGTRAYGCLTAVQRLCRGARNRLGLTPAPTRDSALVNILQRINWVRSAALLAALSVAASAYGQAPVEPLGYVNSELRALASRLIHAPVATESLQSPRPVIKYGPLPNGVTERQVPGTASQPPVQVFVINAAAAPAAPRGAILYLHGGGYVAGDARDDLQRMARLAERLDCVIVSVQYRLAPATRFPGSLEDNYSALKWLHDNAHSLGVDASRIAVLGESAGGGHAAMLTIAARDRNEVPVAFQALIYPMLDDRTGSSRPVAPTIGTLIWRPADNRFGWSALLGRPAGSKRVPAGSVPARVAELSGLPPTFIEVGSIDLFAEEDIDFARRLVGAGVPTELLVVPGAYHGFQYMSPKAEVSQQFTAALEKALARALRGG